MDPLTAAPVVLEAWKVGGIVAGLLAIIGMLVWIGAKDFRRRERESREREARMATALDGCQEKHIEIAKATSSALSNNTNAMRELCMVMRERPCLKEATPPRGAHIPAIEPPSDRRH